MSKWIKPSELPERFHGECWVVWRSFAGTIYPASIRVVQNYHRGTIPEQWVDEGYYSSICDDEYRLMVLEVPRASHEDFK